MSVKGLTLIVCACDDDWERGECTCKADDSIIMLVVGMNGWGGGGEALSLCLYGMGEEGNGCTYV